MSVIDTLPAMFWREEKRKLMIRLHVDNIWLSFFSTLNFLSLSHDGHLLRQDLAPLKTLLKREEMNYLRIFWTFHKVLSTLNRRWEHKKYWICMNTIIHLDTQHGSELGKKSSWAGRKRSQRQNESNVTQNL